MSSLRDMQIFDLNMLDEVDRICKKYNLRYWLSSGTLLGAVRHKGFIPWDDDIDVEMPIKDYKKFCKIAQKEFGDKYFLQNYKTEKSYNELWSKIRANNTTSMPVDQAALNIHWGVCIDVFPIVGTYENKFLFKLQQRLFGLNKTLLSKDFVEIAVKDYSPSTAAKFLMNLPLTIKHFLCDINNLFLYKSFDKSEKSSILFKKLNPKRRTEFYTETVKLEFEGKAYNVPYQYDALLTALYGDYMTPPPVSERTGHEQVCGEIIFDLNKDYKEYKKEIITD